MILLLFIIEAVEKLEHAAKSGVILEDFIWKFDSVSLFEYFVYAWKNKGIKNQKFTE